MAFEFTLNFNSWDPERRRWKLPYQFYKSIHKVNLFVSGKEIAKSQFRLIDEYIELLDTTVEITTNKNIIAEISLQARARINTFTQNVILALIAIIPATLTALSIYLFQPTSVKKTPPQSQIFTNVDTTWAVREAVQATKDYALLSVIMHITLEDITKDGHKVRRSQMRTYYTLKALRDIGENENTFPEEYTSNQVIPEVWAGTNKQEQDGPQRSNYYVRFSAKKNEVITLATGVNDYYSFPLIPTNKVCFGEVPQLSNNQWVWCYPNTSDFINELQIIVDGVNVPISIPNESMYRNNNQNQLSAETAICNKISDNSKCTAVALWRNLSPGECVAVKLNWQ